MLLAKLYADQAINFKRGEVSGKLPESIPDLMLSYLNALNRDLSEGKAQRDNVAVHKDAKAVAWECLKESYRPQTANRDAVILALGGEAAEDRLKYLEKRLRLIETISPAYDRVRYTLDPVAEYLAGLHLVATYRDNEQAWKDFLTNAKQMLPHLVVISGFLSALKDACAVKGKECNVPTFVEQELRSLFISSPEAALARGI